MNKLDVRFDELLDGMFEKKLDELLWFEQINPEAKRKLKGILKHYAKMQHPFAACVRDNTKRFGKDRAEHICASIKDTIRGTTRWRGKNNPRDRGAPGVVGLDPPPAPLDDDVLVLIDKLDEMELWELLGLAAEEEGMSDHLYFKDFPAQKRQKLARKGAALPDGSFPIENTSDLKNAIQAIGRAKNPARAKSHIRKRAKALGATHMLPEGWRR